MLLEANQEGNGKKMEEKPRLHLGIEWLGGQKRGGVKAISMDTSHGFDGMSLCDSSSNEMMK